jgi:hypothetical protein
MLLSLRLRGLEELYPRFAMELAANRPMIGNAA